MSTSGSPAPVPEASVDHGRIINHRLVPPAGVFQIDPVHTFVGFSAQHLVIGRVRGRFETVEGEVTIGEDPIASQLVAHVATASLTTSMAMRDDDLRSERNLDVANHPQMTYRSTEVTELAGGEWSVMGDLTVRGVTRPMSLSVTFGGAVADPFGNLRVAFHATGSISRKDFGLTAELLKEAGGLLVGNDVAITIDAELIRPL